MSDEPSHKRILGAILAGGRATRMGGAVKGLIDSGGGRTVVQRLLDELARAGIEEVVISANDPAPYAYLGLPIVPDLRPDAGPLGGIEAVLAWSLTPPGRFDAALFLPCDLPAIGAKEITALLAADESSEARICVAETGNAFLQALCCVVHNDVLPDISARLDSGRRGVQRAWRGMEAARVHFDDEAPFANINTPGDLDQWTESGSNDL